MTPALCPTCGLPVPAFSRSAGRVYCTAACHQGAEAVQRLRRRLQAAEVADDSRGAQIESERLTVTVFKIRLQRARHLGRRPRLRAFAGRLP